ncbi:MAG: hypothetical protein MJZ93_01220 [Paludibacteraceae bacterium]|nr:hypothetical protein [Paludibacteraceae bacterium]
MKKIGKHILGFILFLVFVYLVELTHYARQLFGRYRKWAILTCCSTLA